MLCYMVATATAAARTRFAARVGCVSECVVDGLGWALAERFDRGLFGLRRLFDETDQ